MTSILRTRLACALALAGALAASARAADPPAPPTTAEVLAASAASDWRTPEPENLLYLDTADGRAVIELAPAFAPRHAENIRALARGRFWDGLHIYRVQDNYVVQWGDADAGEPGKARALGAARTALPAEFDRASDGLAFTRLADGDIYAPEVGWSGGFPAARDPATGRAWLAHCYGMVGAGRDMAADSSNGAELYTVIGHAPRHLDRNITVVGRVLRGIEHLSALPRGTGDLGFYTDPSQRVPIRSLRLAADVPPAEREPLEVLRTDTPTFERLVEARRNRRESWFIDPVGHVELCNVPIPVRTPGD
ncbi:peptidylprolyl isomerase [Coralloluteibacterium stylophorae]|uniref:peptidylprolyl isomerase n=1 Tax=Coralloluteibacterium stylophorae TaxID=1776034 RepID=A0A8J7VU15_9GAMM|nr:peptidylprolyl isomerase [Coralloluteibacterium stylophorae]MBS7456484.1 peptidylprolyl isomerase [Coralloluteibacterium stylophorae]